MMVDPFDAPKKKPHKAVLAALFGFDACLVCLVGEGIESTTAIRLRAR
jgi:hypothetical protein